MSEYLTQSRPYAEAIFELSEQVTHFPAHMTPDLGFREFRESLARHLIIARQAPRANRHP